MALSSEFELQKTCVQYLKCLKSTKKIDWFTAIINETHIGETKYKTNKGFDIGRFSKLKKQKEQGLNRGLCDLLIVIKGKVFFVELKYGNNTCSKPQIEVIKHLNACELQAFLVYSFVEFETLINDLLDSVDRDKNILEILENILNTDYKNLKNIKKDLQKALTSYDLKSNYEDLAYFKKGLKGSNKLKNILNK